MIYILGFERQPLVSGLELYGWFTEVHYFLCIIINKKWTKIKESIQGSMVLVYYKPGIMNNPSV